jgi:putative oxidoreductase
VPTTIDAAALLVRLVAGAIFVAQGYIKLFRPPDASHGRANLEAMIRNRGIARPGELALLVSALELVCGTALLVGFATRLAIIPLAVILVVAIAGFKFRSGFVGGWDWPLSVLTLLAVSALLGAGAWSVDAVLRLT